MLLGREEGEEESDDCFQQIKIKANGPATSVAVATKKAPSNLKKTSKQRVAILAEEQEDQDLAMALALSRSVMETSVAESLLLEANNNPISPSGQPQHTTTTTTTTTAAAAKKKSSKSNKILRRKTTQQPILQQLSFHSPLKHSKILAPSSTAPGGASKPRRNNKSLSSNTARSVLDPRPEVGASRMEAILSSNTSDYVRDPLDIAEKQSPPTTATKDPQQQRQEQPLLLPPQADSAPSSSLWAQSSTTGEMPAFKNVSSSASSSSYQSHQLDEIHTEYRLKCLEEDRIVFVRINELKLAHQEAKQRLLAERNEKIRLLFERKVNDVSTSAAVAASNTCSSKDAKPKPPLIPPPQSSTVPTILAPMRKLQEPQPENNKHASSSSSLQPTPPLKSQQSSTFPAAKTASPPSKNIAIFNDLDDLDDDLNALESIDFLEDIISSQGSIQFSSGLSQASQERRRLVGAAIIDEDGDEDDIPVDELADSMQMVNIIDDDGLIFDNDDGRNNDEGSQDEFVSAHQDVEENNIPSQSSFRIDDNLDLQDNFEEPTSALLVYSPVKHSVDDAKSSSILLLSHDSNYDNNFNNRDSDCSSIISDGSDTNINTTVTSLTLNRDKYVAEKLSSKLLKSLSLKTTTAAIVPSSLPKSKISKSAKNSMMPDYSVMSHADLKKLGSKYGLRPGPKSFLVYELELIWKSLHCQNEGAVVSQQQQQCLGLFSTLAASAASYKKSGKSTAASVSQDPTSSTQPCSLSPEQQVAVASKSESRQALVHSSLKRFIVSTPLLYSQILRYEPIDIEVLLEEVIRARDQIGFKCSRKALSTFLDEMGIVSIETSKS